MFLVRPIARRSGFQPWWPIGVSDSARKLPGSYQGPPAAGLDVLNSMDAPFGAV